MKKIAIAVFAVLLVLVGAFFYYQAKTAKLAIEDVLPADAAVYARVSNLEKNLNELKQTKLWRNIKNIDIEKVMKKSGASSDDVKQYREFTENMSSFVSGILLNKFFGQEVAVAVYPVKLNPDNFSKAFLEAASGIVVVTRISSDAQFIELVTKVYQKLDKKIVVTSEKYEGKEITIIKVNDNVNIAYTKIKDLLVISLDKKTIFASLDTYAKRKPSLGQDGSYLSTTAQLPKQPESITYANFKMLISGMQQLNELASANSKEPNRYEIQGLEKFTGFEGIGIASVGGKIAKNKMVVTFNKNLMDPTLAKTYSLKPVVNSSIHFIPKNIIGYQWTCFDPELYWESFKNDAPQTKSYAKGDMPPVSSSEVIKGIESALGVSIEKDIVPVLGNESGALLSDINLNGPVPIPELVIFVKVKDKEAVKNIFSKALQKNNIPVEEEEYQGKKIKYIPSPLGVSLQPAYCLVDDYLLISTSNNLIKACLDAYGDKANSLLANVDFESFKLNFNEKNISIFFLDANLLLERLKGVGDWTVGWVSLLHSRRVAFMKEAEKELNDFKAAIQDDEAQLKVLKAKQESMKAEANTPKGQSSSDIAKNTELVELENQIKAKEENLILDKDELEEKEIRFDGMVKKNVQQDIDPGLVKFYLDEVVYPIMDGLKIIKATASVTNFKENTVETVSYYNVQGN